MKNANRSIEQLLDQFSEQEEAKVNEQDEKIDDNIEVLDKEEEEVEEEEEEKKDNSEDDNNEEEEEVILNPDEEDQDDTDKNVGDIDDKAFFEFASKKLGREINSYDDLTTQTEYVEDNEQLKQLNKFVKDTNRDVRDWFKMDSIDIDNMTDEQLVKEDMKLKYGKQLTSSQIDRKFSNEYKLDSEEYDSDEVELAQINLKMAAAEAKEGLSRIKTGYQIPVNSPKDTGKPTEQEVKQFQADKDAYLQRMNKEVDSIKYFDFNVDGQKVRYKLSKEDISSIKKRNSNLENYLDGFRDNDGNLDVAALSYNSFSTRENMEKIIKAVKGRYVTQGVDKQLGRQKNTKLPSSDGKKTQESKDNKDVKKNFSDAILTELGVKKRQRIVL